MLFCPPWLNDLKKFIYCVAAVCMLAAFLILPPPSASASTLEEGTGFRFLQLRDPVSGKPMRAALFYPAHGTTTITKTGPVDINAEENAKPRPGKFPLILLSHGSGGSLLSHHDSGAYLARNGFIVAALEHPGDNFRDTSGVGSDRVLSGRILQVSAALDQLLGDASLRDMADVGRIGIAGFSAGGYTALAAVGATPKPDLLGTYCARQTRSVLCAGGGTVRVSNPPMVAKPDARLRAAFVMNPVGALFDRESLSHVGVPVYLLAAAADEVLPIAENAHKIRSGLPSSTQYREIPAAGHFVFLAPCSRQMKLLAAQLCEDRPGVDRTAVHDLLNREMVSFFQRSLR
jgi:predicted dienelactone hydrolase